MRLVDAAASRPHRCAVLPYVGNSNASGFIDAGVELAGWDPHVYVSLEAVREMARLIGWGPPGDDLEVVALKAEIEDLKAQLVEADRELGAVHVLRQKGWTGSAKPGPRKTAA